MTPQPPGSWPAAGGNWEGGTVVGGRRLHHAPWEGWHDAGPASAPGPFLLPEPNRLVNGRIHRDPRTLSRRSRLARWLRRRRYALLGWASVTVVVGYAAVFIVFFERTMPDLTSALVLAGVAVVLVGLLLAAVLWARHE